MKAVRVHTFGLNHPMQVDEVRDPTPGPGEILIRARAAGVNWVDLLVRSGDNPRSKLLTLPYIPGDNTAGEVVGVGPGTEGFKVGQRVFGMGFNSYATLVVTKAGYVGELPESYGYEEGAAIPSPFFTAWNAVVFTARASAGETVLVHGGAGGVGGAAVQLAKRMGCRVFATEISKERTDICKTLGADETINFREQDFAARCKELTDGRGVDVIIEISTTDNFDKDLDAIAIHGRIVVVGFRMGQGPKTDFRVFSLMQKNATVHGIAFAHLYPTAPRTHPSVFAAFARGHLQNEDRSPFLNRRSK